MAIFYPEQQENTNLKILNIKSWVFLAKEYQQAEFTKKLFPPLLMLPQLPQNLLVHLRNLNSTDHWMVRMHQKHNAKAASLQPLQLTKQTMAVLSNRCQAMVPHLQGHSGCPAVVPPREPAARWQPLELCHISTAQCPTSLVPRASHKGCMQAPGMRAKWCLEARALSSLYWTSWCTVSD